MNPNARQGIRLYSLFSLKITKRSKFITPSLNSQHEFIGTHLHLYCDF